MKEATITKIVSPNNKTAAFICPRCEILTVEDISKYFHRNSEATVEIQCKCGHKYRVFLERRQYYRKKTNLSGTMTRVRTENLMKVVDLSKTGIRVKVDRKHDFKVGDHLYLEFNLDDEKKKKIIKKVAIKTIDGSFIGAEFFESESNVTPYLYTID